MVVARPACPYEFPDLGHVGPAGPKNQRRFIAISICVQTACDNRGMSRMLLKLR